MIRGRFAVWHRAPLPTLGWGVLVALVGLIGLSGLYHFNPQEHAFYPRCLFFETTGLWCPGCGGLRASHQLLHGNLRAAFRLNPLVVFVLPGLLVGLAEWWLLPAGKRRFLITVRHPNFIVGVGGVLCGFGIARNLPLLEWISRACG